MKLALEGGYIKLFRRLIKWEWYGDINTSRLFIHLLLTVNYEPGRWQGVDINPGQRATSILKLSEETKLSRQQTRTSLNKLKSTGEITTITTSKYTIVTVEKYSDYQVLENETKKQLNHRPNKRATNEQPSSNHQITTKEESKKARKQEEKEEKNKPPYPLDEFLFSKRLTEKIIEWLTYKQEKNETYKPTGFKSLLKIIKTKSVESGEIAVMDLMDLCMASNWKGIVWDKIQEEKPNTKIFGKFENVKLTDAEYEELQIYENVKVRLDDVSVILKNRPQKDHYAFCLKIAKEDAWPKKRVISHSEVVNEKTEMPEELKDKLGDIFGKTKRGN